MSRWQDNKTFKCTRNITKNKKSYILRQYDQGHKEICTRMSIMLKEKIKQKTWVRTRNK